MALDDDGLTFSAVANLSWSFSGCCLRQTHVALLHHVALLQTHVALLFFSLDGWLSSF